MSEKKNEYQPDYDEKVIEIAIERLVPFENHPFKVQEDEAMEQLMDSIGKFGILNPLIVRPRMEGVYEIISGHRRKYAAEKLGYRKVPVIIRMLLDEDSVIAMVDSNLQRTEILPSEKAKAYKMKYDAIIQARKNKNKSKLGRNYGQVDLEKAGQRSISYIGELSGDSPKQVQRFMKLNDLLPEILEKVDAKEMGLTPAVDIAYIPEEGQKIIWDAMNYTQSTPSMAQAKKLKDLSKEGKLTEEEAKNIMGAVAPGNYYMVSFRNESIKKYFPKGYTSEMMKKKIISLLEMWNRMNQDEMED